jgi:hypothetical protein
VSWPIGPRGAIIPSPGGAAMDMSGKPVGYAFAAIAALLIALAIHLG